MELVPSVFFSVVWMVCIIGRERVFLYAGVLKKKKITL